MIKAYHRPVTIEAALELLSHPGVKTVALTSYAALTDAPLSDPSIDEVVDLQDIGLDSISLSGAHLTIEALVRLQTIVDHPSVPQWLREIARQEEPSTFRNMRTLASILLNPSSESCLLAALLVSGAQVRVRTATGESCLSLADFLGSAANRIAATIPVSVSLEPTGTVRVEKIGRTPADKPIVAVVARRTPPGDLIVALCGVAPLPIVVDPAQVDSLEPPGDFRGSVTYRKAMAKVLVERIMAISS
jgi:CO/xanthine dehydrogenase FAD-binding subunit